MIEMFNHKLRFSTYQTSWSIRVKIDELQDDGSISNIDDFTYTNSDSPPRAASGDPGKYKRGNYSRAINAADDSGLIVWVDQSGIGDFYLELKYRDG